MYRSWKTSKKYSHVERLPWLDSYHNLFTDFQPKDLKEEGREARGGVAQSSHCVASLCPQSKSVIPGRMSPLWISVPQWSKPHAPEVFYEPSSLAGAASRNGRLASPAGERAPGATLPLFTHYPSHCPYHFAFLLTFQHYNITLL
jgi:hypothetical protein